MKTDSFLKTKKKIIMRAYYKINYIQFYKTFVIDYD